MQLDDTIIAVSSAQGGLGVRAIVRLSGPGAWGVAGTVMAGDYERGTGWREVVIEVDEIRVAGQVMMFRGPRSFTGQDVAELHVPNSPALVDLLMEKLLRNAGERGVAARMAEPGEFSARAFFNGKIDLTEAEGIAATINATNETQLRAAAGLREGDLHRWTQRTAEELANLLALVEAGIDFADEEDIRFIDTERLRAGIEKISAEIRGQLGSAVRIDRLAALPTVVLVGMPNVGKSSLMNALAGVERSIVSAVAGTTRDILSAEMETPEGRVRLMDVPGEELPTDEMRRKMMAAREGAMLEADLIVEVVDATGAAARDFEATAGRIRIQNKADLLSEIPGEVEEAWRYVSAKTGLHLAELRAAIGRLTARDQTAGTSRLALNHRHRELLRQALDGLEAAGAIAAGGTVNAHPELLAAELRQALDVIGQITGTISPDDVLGRIFSTFCLGK